MSDPHDTIAVLCDFLEHRIGRIEQGSCHPVVAAPQSQYQRCWSLSRPEEPMLSLSLKIQTLGGLAQNWWRRGKERIVSESGLEQYKHKLDFTRKKLCSNPDDSYPIHILITSLINWTLLNGCSMALEPLEMAEVDRFTEVLGFSPQQRMTYFKKFFGDSNLGAEAFQYVQESATLYTMRFNPSYCWIICSVLRNYFNLAEKDRGAAPRTVTELFVMFLYSILTHNKSESEDLRGILMNLGKMAYSGVDIGVLVFSEKQEIINFGLQPVLSTPSPSGFLKMILQKESTLENTTYTFIHLNMQDFMAACYFFLDPSGNIEELLGKLNSCKDDQFEILIRFPSWTV
ncbi:NLRP3 protein, partial [Polypterus senegalus]|nr:NLRP3 protein [Polypterus senegalus]